MVPGANKNGRNTKKVYCQGNCERERDVCRESFNFVAQNLTKIYPPEKETSFPSNNLQGRTVNLREGNYIGVVSKLGTPNKEHLETNHFSRKTQVDLAEGP